MLATDWALKEVGARFCACVRVPGLTASQKYAAIPRRARISEAGSDSEAGSYTAMERWWKSMRSGATQGVREHGERVRAFR